MKKRLTLVNGTRLVYETIGRAKSFSMGVWINAGSIYESRDNSGISHFVEHLMFKGTKSQSAMQLRKMLEDVGGYISASTSREWMWIEAYCLDKHYDRALYAISDMIENSLFEEREINLERMVILDEIKLYSDASGGQIHDRLTDFIWQDNALGKSPLGTVKTVNNFSRNDLWSFYGNLFSPETITISAAGNIPETFISDIEKYFNFPKKKSALTANINGEHQAGIKLCEKDLELVHFCVGAKSFPANDKYLYALDVLNTMLGGSTSSRLFYEIREKRGMAYSIYSYNTYFKNTGLFSVYAGVKKNNVVPCLKVILKEFANFRKGGFTESELSQAKEQLKVKYTLSLESPYYRMIMLAYYERYCNTLFNLKNFLAAIDSVMKEDIINVSEKIFQNDNLTFVSAGPFADNKSIENLFCKQ